MENELINMENQNYPLDKRQAEILLEMTKTPAWSLFVNCISFEAQVYKEAAVNTAYGPYAIEKFRFNQAIGQNLVRIISAVVEQANSIRNNENNLDRLNDALDLIK